MGWACLCFHRMMLKAVILGSRHTKGYFIYKPLFVGMIAGQLMGGAVDGRRLYTGRSGMS